jgi:hypothetical protein
MRVRRVSASRRNRVARRRTTDGERRAGSCDDRSCESDCSRGCAPAVHAAKESRESPPVARCLWTALRRTSSMSQCLRRAGAESRRAALDAQRHRLACSSKAAPGHQAGQQRQHFAVSRTIRASARSQPGPTRSPQFRRSTPRDESITLVGAWRWAVALDGDSQYVTVLGGSAFVSCGGLLDSAIQAETASRSKRIEVPIRTAGICPRLTRLRSACTDMPNQTDKSSNVRYRGGLDS